jgi:hypothetical protein
VLTRPGEPDSDRFPQDDTRARLHHSARGICLSVDRTSDAAAKEVKFSTHMPLMRVR